MTDQELLEQFQAVIGMMEKLATKDDIREAEVRINIKIENEVSRKIESLFDGYKLTHEKQWEMERQAELFEKQILDLQARIALLESKIA